MSIQAESASAGKTGSIDLSEDDRSKDGFFHDVAALSDAMIAAHGRDFAMGALILAARFIAENKAFTKSSEPAARCGGGCHASGPHEHRHEHEHHTHKS